MQVGLVSPVVTAIPGQNAPWERSAGVADLGTIAETADELGFHHLTCSEHIAVPVDGTAARGDVFWDPLATLGYLAARTTRIKLATQIVVLGLHHPLAIAKRYGTLDLISGGRLVLGVGLGSIREEFELLGAPFGGRAGRGDEAMRALRASLSRRQPAFAGEFYAYSDMVVEPHAVQEEVPMWVGGRSRASLQRAVSLGNGWVPTGLSGETVKQLLASTELPPGFEVVLGTGPLDPLGDPDRSREAVRRASDAGATVVNAAITSRSASHYCEQLHELRSIVVGLTPDSTSRE